MIPILLGIILIFCTYLRITFFARLISFFYKLLSVSCKICFISIFHILYTITIRLMEFLGFFINYIVTVMICLTDMRIDNLTVTCCIINLNILLNIIYKNLDAKFSFLLWFDTTLKRYGFQQNSGSNKIIIFENRCDSV